MPTYPITKEEFVNLGGGRKEKLEPIQPKALLLLNTRATAYTAWLIDREEKLDLTEPRLTESLSHYAWMRGLTDVDIIDLRAFLTGTIKVGIEEEPPDPPEPSPSDGDWDDIEDVRES